MFTKILIANRGEIACRIIGTAHRMGIKCVAVYSDADRTARHVRLADEAVHIGASPSSESYLVAERILKAAKDTGAQAIHPGYGFLSENAAFADACEKAGIVFIGPSAKSILAMGLKDGAKDIMQKAGVPIVPGYQGDNQDADFLQEQAGKIGYPVLIKAVAGGGGKGMRLVEREQDFKDLLGNCQREGKASFGNDHVLIEKYITKPRHIEVQVFGDKHGHAVHLFERDCSLQRRHQKVVEEAPAPGITGEMREAMGEAAVQAAKAIDYHGAGTIEFIVDTETHDFYFMEMNTRLQVEHPVTEFITTQDLVEWQLRVAHGEKLPLSQGELAIHGHAFEVRLYAEDPAQDFMPQTGTLTHFDITMPFLRKQEFIDDAARDPCFRRESIRVDTGVETGDSVTSYYDPMIAKLITHGKTREEAAAKMRALLEQTHLTGLNTNQEFLHNIFTQEDFLRGDVDTGFIPRHEAALIPDNYGKPTAEELALLALHQVIPQSTGAQTNDPWSVSDNWRAGLKAARNLHFICRGTAYILHVHAKGAALDFEMDGQSYTATLINRAGNAIEADINGTKFSAAILGHKSNLTLYCEGRVIAAHIHSAEEGEEAGESSGRIVTNMPGRIVSVLVKKGQKVEKNQPLLIMESMKVEITIRASIEGEVEDLPVAVNDQVADGALLVSIKNEDAA